MKIRELSDAEKTARKKYNGMTRREFNAKHGKFANHVAKTDTAGSFEVVAIFLGSEDKPQSAPFPNLDAALSRYNRICSNESLVAVKLVEEVAVLMDGKAVGTRQRVLHSFTRNNQEFANSRIEALWRKKSDGSLVKEAAALKNPALIKSAAEGGLELYKFVAIGGQPWWELRRG